MRNNELENVKNASRTLQKIIFYGTKYLYMTLRDLCPHSKTEFDELTMNKCVAT